MRDRACCQHAQADQVLELLGVWVGIKLDQIDQAACDADARAASLPDRRQLMELIGELTVRVLGLEQQVQQLQQERRGGGG